MSPSIVHSQNARLVSSGRPLPAALSTQPRIICERMCASLRWWPWRMPRTSATANTMAIKAIALPMVCAPMVSPPPVQAARGPEHGMLRPGKGRNTMAVARLGRRLREHDWFAATIEVLIVIVGILVALQVSNWNADRQERRLARAYEQRLHEELQSDLRNIALTREFWDKVAGYQAAASRHAETGELADGSAWKTLLAYYQSSQLRPFELEDTAFTELR